MLTIVTVFFAKLFVVIVRVPYSGAKVKAKATSLPFNVHISFRSM